MKFKIEKLADATVVQLSGRVGADETGALCDILVAEVQGGAKRLVLDLAHGTELARPGVRGIVVAASLMQAARRPFRIVADPAMARFLRAVSFQHLLAIAPDRATALSQITGLPATAPMQTPANRQSAPRRPGTLRLAQS